MKCTFVIENLEQYIMGELNENETQQMDEHLKQCDRCSKEFEETFTLIKGLQNLTTEIMLKDDLKINLKEQFNTKHPKGKNMKFLIAVTALSTLLFLTSTTLLAFPALAAKYTPTLPIVKSMTEFKSKAETLEVHTRNLQEQTEQLKSEIESLKIEIRKIDGTELKVVESKPSPLSEQVNAQIQSMAINFIKAQYTGDMETLKRLSTSELYTKITQNRQDYIWPDKNSLIFSSITNVAQFPADDYYGGDYGVFVRISDSRADSEFQENFILTKVNEVFKIKEIEMDV